MSALLPMAQAAPASPSPTVLAAAPPPRAVMLEPGRSVVVRVERDGTLGSIDYHPGARPPARGEARFELRAVAGGSELAAIGAVGRPVGYRVTWVGNTGSTYPVGPCSLPAGRAAVQRWPYRVIGVMIADLRYTDRPKTCR